MACFSASAPVILLGIQMEKKIAPSAPSFMRGMSMLPLELRDSRSKSPSRNRWVVSACVSTTMEEKWSLRARALSSSYCGFAVIPIGATAQTVAPAKTKRRSISPRSAVWGLSCRLQLSTRALDLLHHTQRVFAENFANVRVRIALAQQRLGNFGQLGAILHAFGHVRTVEVGAQANVVGTNQLHGMVNVRHDIFPAHVRQLALGSHLLLDPFRFLTGAFHVV